MPDSIFDPFLGTNRFLGKYIKPDFQFQSSKSIIMKASLKRPQYFVISGRVYTQEKDLECDLSGSGISSGLTLQASTPYYLYATVVSSGLKLSADLNDPSIGHKDYRSWTYLGAFVTNSSSLITEFISSNGFYRSNNALHSSVSTTATSLTSKTITPCPTTIKDYYGFVQCTGTVPGAYAVATGGNAISTDEAIYQFLNVSGVAIGSFGFVAAMTPGTIYVKSSNAANTAAWITYGWMENQSEWL